MTQGTNTPKDPIDRLANIVERFIDVSSHRMDQVENRQGQLERAQIRFQEQLGELAAYARRSMERQDQHERELQEYRQRVEQHDRKMEEFRQRQAESDERFNVMLQEIRFLIRQQRSTGDDPGQEGAA